MLFHDDFIRQEFGFLHDVTFEVENYVTINFKIQSLEPLIHVSIQNKLCKYNVNDKVHSVRFCLYGHSKQRRHWAAVHATI